MKKTLLLIIAALFNLAAHAQTFTAGPKAGISHSVTYVKELKNSPEEYKDAENVLGYHLGGFARLSGERLFIQPEVYVTSSGGKISITDNQNGTDIHTEKFNFNRLNIPVMVGYKFFDKLRVQAGPVATVLLRAKLDSENLKEHLDGSDWGYQAGIGVDFWNLTFDLKYENITHRYKNNDSDVKFKLQNEQVILSIGFNLID